MGIIRKMIGPKSKYDESIPYTYEARVPIVEIDNEFNYYIADTICGLIAELIKSGIKPNEAEIYEIFREQEKKIDVGLYTRDGDWITKPELCETFKEHYDGHIWESGCSFEDRD